MAGGVITRSTPDDPGAGDRDRGRSGSDQPKGSARELVLVSHRGPVHFEREAGRRVVQRGAGGLVTALRDLVRHVDAITWVCAAATDEDHAVAERGGYETVEVVPDHTCRVRMLAIEPDVHHDFYAVIANPLLWFIQHYLWDHASAPDITKLELDAWEHGYVEVNRRFADAVIGTAAGLPPGSVVMVHDYHFYLVPKLVRDAGVDVFLHFFVHIPWPQPDSWRVLPPHLREPIIEGLLGSDIVAFHTERYARNFLLTCQELLGLDVDCDTGIVHVGDRDVAVRFYPISVDESTLNELADTPEASRYEEELSRTRREHLILRVDRTDPSKNCVRGFRAYERMLEQHPELHERVTFLALLQPSRQDVPQYAAYTEEINRAAARVNERFGRGDWLPVDLRFGENLPLAVAAYRLFDVLMVNAVFDGMNLVAKEAIVVNARDGVLALSENTGAHHELGAIAVTLSPFDIEQQAAALYEALTMPADERRIRRAAGVEIVRHNSVQKWLDHQLSDVDAAMHDIEQPLSPVVDVTRADLDAIPATDPSVYFS
ncbi:MAG: trehalose 6-phosphate synthase [Actinomycetota bacterium]|nr:trehalose 6-phosphate synthase [Actinomycetota bacterium]